MPGRQLMVAPGLVNAAILQECDRPFSRRCLPSATSGSTVRSSRPFRDASSSLRQPAANLVQIRISKGFTLCKSHNGAVQEALPGRQLQLPTPCLS